MRLGRTRDRSPGVAARVGEPLLDPLHRAPAAPDQVPEPLDHDAPRQHVAEAGDALAVEVAVVEGLGEVLTDQEREVGVFGVHVLPFVAVAVDGDDAVGVLRDHDAVGVHAEGAHVVLEPETMSWSQV